MIYVDDMLIRGSNHKVIVNTKEMFNKHFDIKDMGLADVILGMKIARTISGIVLAQSHYVENMLKKFNTFESFPA